MSNNELYFHYVSTHEQAEDLIRQNENFWVSNCGCRENAGNCKQSRIDVCLCFNEYDSGSGTDFHQVDKKFAEELMREAKQKNLVTRPFRDEKDFSQTGGICFCCQDCCGYFTDPAEKCDKGIFIEKTDPEVCNDCGLCVEICYFGARTIKNGKLQLNRENCYGCGLCIKNCPLQCIQMINR